MKLKLEEISFSSRSVEETLNEVQRVLTARHTSKRVSGDSKYCFIAFSDKGEYVDKVTEVIKSYPQVHLASVSPLHHIPNCNDRYNLYMFRLKNRADEK